MLKEFFYLDRNVKGVLIKKEYEKENEKETHGKTSLEKDVRVIFPNQTQESLAHCVSATTSRNLFPGNALSARRGVWGSIFQQTIDQDK